MALVLTAFDFMFGLTCIMRVSAQQSDTDTADPGDAARRVPHPAHIHPGICAALGDVVFPLNDVAVTDTSAAPEASPNLALASRPVASPVDAPPVASLRVATEGTVAESSIEVAVSLDDILADEHAINVHESTENIESYIACGDLTGTATDGQLTIGAGGISCFRAIVRRRADVAAADNRHELTNTSRGTCRGRVASSLLVGY